MSVSIGLIATIRHGGCKEVGYMEWLNPVPIPLELTPIHTQSFSKNIWRVDT